jgi:hypothetical protein
MIAESSPGDTPVREAARKISHDKNRAERIRMQDARRDAEEGATFSEKLAGRRRTELKLTGWAGDEEKSTRRRTQIQPESEKPTPQSESRTGRQKSEESHLIKAFRAAIEKAHRGS